MNGMVDQQGNDRQLRELALFAGAGGGILGGKLLGWRTVCAVEINPYCAGVLVQRQNDGILAPFPIWDDVKNFYGRAWRGIVDVVSGGFPCQDISAAGRGDGIDGERSGLWREMARIIGEVRPRFAFMENSPMLTSRGLGRVLGDLAEMGYDAMWGVISAENAGAPHKRERLWIVAYSVRERVESKKGRNLDGEILHQIEWEKSANSIRRPNKWSSEPNFPRVAYGIPNRLDRHTAAGNGQVPIVARIAWEILSEGIAQ